MPMTQKDLEAMAEAVRESNARIARSWGMSSADYATLEDMAVALEIVVSELADACARQYEGAHDFDRGRFMEASGF